MASKSERVELEMKIMKCRLMARQMAADPEESKRIHEHHASGWSKPSIACDRRSSAHPMSPVLSSWGQQEGDD